MKKLLTTTALFFAISAQAIPETYTFDNTHTYVSFEVSHFGFSHPSGKWMTNGTLTLDEAKPENSKADITIQVNDVMTGVPKLDEHLRGVDFFDVQKFPTATFVSNKIQTTGKNTAKVFGTLTLHGESKPIVLNVKLNKLDVSPITKKKTAGFTATTTLKRSDFGISKYVPDISDDVQIKIEAEATKVE